MNKSPYQSLSTKELLEKTHSAVAKERHLQAEVIDLLLEVDRRRLYAFLGYRSLFDFCVKELRYSESAAWRRVSAMRLIKDIPQAVDKLKAGELSLKTLTTVQNFLNSEEKQLHKTYTPEQKISILASVENKSARETEAILAGHSPDRPTLERERSLNGSDIEIRFVADTPLVGKFNRLKDLNSHRDPSRSYRGLFDWLTDVGLKTADPLLKSIQSGKKQKAQGPKTEPTETKFFSAPSTSHPKSKSSYAPTRYIPNQIRVQVWQRDAGRCTYINPERGYRCESTSQIEIDHIIPLALGGKTELDNLRLYCRMHNQDAAKRTYGENKIQREMSARAEKQNPEPKPHGISSDENREPARAYVHGATEPDQSSA